MDSTAIALCMDNHLHIVVLNIFEKNSVLKCVQGEKIGTIIAK